MSKLNVGKDYDPYDRIAQLEQELRYAQESQDRLVDALKACKERNGEPTN